MAGNSSRRGSVRKDGTKKGAVVGSGGQRRKALQPKGPTPKATERPAHPAAKRKRAGERQAASAGRRSQPTKGDIIAGRNAVGEALAAGVPATVLHVLDNIEADDRVRTALALANKSALPIAIATRTELDRVAGTQHHQGLALAAAPFAYSDIADLPSGATAPVLVALDHITDPQNLGAIARSATAFGAAGLLVPQRRSAPVTAAAWKASAGTLARMPVARVPNLVSALTDLQRQGYFVIGLDSGAGTSITELSEALVNGPLVLVVGSEGSGLARLTAARCDLTVAIAMGGRAESLNASVAAGVALYELMRRR